MPVKYVKDFEFPAEKGFSGSTGQVRNVRPYTRRVAKRAVGGPVHAKKGGRTKT